MSALDKIIAEILDQAALTADEVSAEAAEKVVELYEKAQLERDDWKRQFDLGATEEYRDIVSQAQSRDRQNRRLKLLEAKNRVIDEVVTEAKAKVIAMPDDEYTEFLFALFCKNAQALNGIIRFAPGDFLRIPEDFPERCSAVFPEYSLNLSKDIDSIDHGFVLIYGDIFVDCSIDGIFSSAWQTLRDVANQTLIVGD